MDDKELDEILNNYYAPIKLPDSNRDGLKRDIKAWHEADKQRAKLTAYERGLRKGWGWSAEGWNAEYGMDGKQEEEMFEQAIKEYEASLAQLSKEESHEA